MCSESPLKKVKQGNELENYKASSVQLKETSFGRWLKSHRALLKEKYAYETKKNEKKYKNINYDAPEKLTPAGLLFLCFRMPLEIQQEIMQHLIDRLSPTTVGIVEQDFILDSTKTHLHNERPFVYHKPNFNGIMCAALGCIPQDIEPSYGYFKNSTVQTPAPKIDYLWRLLREKSKHTDMTDPILLMFNPHNQISQSGHKPISDAPTRANPVYHWNIANPSKNKRILRDPQKHDFNLSDAIAFSDADNYHKNKPTLPLSDKSVTAFNQLKRKVGELLTPENHITVEPLFADNKLNPTTRPQLQRQDAFINELPDSLKP